MSESIPSADFLDLELKVEVWLAEEEIELKRLLSLEQGDALRLSRDPDEPVDLVINGSVVASGELVVVDGKFGFRVTSSAQQKLADLEKSPEVQAQAEAVGQTDPGPDTTVKANAKKEATP